MRNRLFATGLGVAIGLGVFGVLEPAPSRGLSATDLAYRYVSDVAKANNVKLETEKIVAVRESGDGSVVLVKVTYHLDGYQGLLSRTFRVRMLKSGWYVSTFDAA
jgi:hypothetical protein